MDQLVQLSTLKYDHFPANRKLADFCRRHIQNQMNIARGRMRLLLPSALAVLLHNGIHESVHFFAACLLGEDVLEFRFLTNGWGTSQVIYATPVDERIGAHWLVIAWSPAVITVLIGYVFYLNRERWLTRWQLLDASIWYMGLFFLCLDPFYFAVLSIFLGGDVNAVRAVGWTPWPVRLVALTVLVFNVWLMIGWRRIVRSHASQYLTLRHARDNGGKVGSVWARGDPGGS